MKSQSLMLEDLLCPLSQRALDRYAAASAVRFELVS